jgi:hypothetical protein
VLAWFPTRLRAASRLASIATFLPDQPSRECRFNATNFRFGTLAKAGILLAGEGLKPSSAGVRVRFSGKQRTVVDGPCVETKELIAGFWLWQVKSREEAIAWLKRCPNPHDEDTEVEIRELFEADDFGAEFTPELRAQEERIRAQVASKL